MNAKEVLLGSDEHFRKLVLEHQSLDQQIHNLSSLPFLTDEQRYEEAALKKRKLALKDRMEAAMRSHHLHAGASTQPSH